MNILVTIDQNYVTPLTVMLHSLIKVHPNVNFKVYLLHTAIPSPIINQLQTIFQETRILLFPIQVDQSRFQDFPTTNRYPYEMYFRLFASTFLPTKLERILYLDPDLIVINPLTELYDLPLDSYYFAAATHVDKGLERINQIRLNYEDGIYVNSGVLLMNLKALRAEQDTQTIINYVEKYKSLLFLPDQDILSAVYPDKILEISAQAYNMTERMWIKEKLLSSHKDLDWIEQNCHIIHYIGKNKPWKEDYLGSLDRYYHQVYGYMLGLQAKE